VDASTGLVSLLGTSSSVVELIASAGSGASNSVFFYCNEEATVMGLDVGAQTGLAMPPAKPGETFGFPVYVRLADQSFDFIQMEIAFDESVIQPVGDTVTVTAGRDSVHVMTKAGGTIKLDVQLGSPTNCDTPGCNIGLITIEMKLLGHPFDASTDSVVEFTTDVKLFLRGIPVWPGYVQLPLITKVPILGGRRKLTRRLVEARAIKPREARALAAEGCPVRDFNSDCKFDLRDALSLIWIVTDLDTTVGLSDMDANRDGIIDFADIDAFRQVLVGNFALTRSIVVQPIERDSCSLAINIEITDGNDVPLSEGDVAVYIIQAFQSSSETKYSATFGSKSGAPFRALTGGNAVVAWKTADRGSGIFGVTLDLEGEPSKPTGLSILVATLDENGGSSEERTQLLVSKENTGFEVPALAKPLGKNLGLYTAPYYSLMEIQQDLNTEQCKLDSDRCAGNPCLNGATCSSRGKDGYQCGCVGGFSGVDCKVDPPTTTNTTTTATESTSTTTTATGTTTTDVCTNPSPPCGHNGSCIDSVEEPGVAHSCACKWPWNVDAYCTRHVCSQNNGGCGDENQCNTEATESKNLCTCKSNRTGPDCDLDDVEVALGEASDSASVSGTTLVGIIVCCVIAFFLLPLLAYKARSKKGKDMLSASMRDLPTTLHTFDHGGAGQIVSPAMQLADLQKKLRDAPSDFEAVAKFPEGKRFRVSEDPLNKERNRYRDIRTYDDTRVFLMNDDNDYINANNVVIPVAGRQFWYIAAQGPNPTTVPHFWDMVWEQQSQIIVMLTSCVESGTTKCEQYWPEQQGVTKQYGKRNVTLLKMRKNHSFVLRGFHVQDIETQESHMVWQLHYTAWPDHGVPESESAMLEFVDELRAVRAKYIPPGSPTAPWPIVVHCSAGIGRTGVLMALEIGLAKIEAGETVNMQSLLKELREQRYGLIQRAEQYSFVTACLISALQNSNVLQLADSSSV
jgi:protein tyrosine phosphatase